MGLNGERRRWGGRDGVRAGRTKGGRAKEIEKIIGWPALRCKTRRQKGVRICARELYKKSVDGGVAYGFGGKTFGLFIG